jgi:hypothetical protein
MIFETAFFVEGGPLSIKPFFMVFKNEKTKKKYLNEFK